MLITFIGGELDGQCHRDYLVPNEIVRKYQIACFVTDDLKEGMEVRLASDASIAAAVEWLRKNVRDVDWHLASQLPFCGDLTSLSPSHLDCIPKCRKVVTYYFDDAETLSAELVLDSEGAMFQGHAYPKEETWKAVLTFLNRHHFDPRMALALGKMQKLRDK